jgi:hypothetical protein
MEVRKDRSDSIVPSSSERSIRCEVGGVTSRASRVRSSGVRPDGWRAEGLAWGADFLVAVFGF